MSKLNTYEHLQKWLKATETSTTPSELHGLLCGLIVGSCVNPSVPILQTILDHLRMIRNIKTNDQGLVAQWSVDTFHELKSEDYSFYPRLPFEGSLSQRLEAAATWCRSFMDALTDCGIWSVELDGEAKEACEDLVAASQVNTEMNQPTEADETIYEELIEYIKICVLTIFTSFTSTTPMDHHDCHCHKHVH